MADNPVPTHRVVVQFGLDGRSKPIYRYLDEMHLPDWQRSTVPAADRPTPSSDVAPTAKEPDVAAPTASAVRQAIATMQALAATLDAADGITTSRSIVRDVGAGASAASWLIRQGDVLAVLAPEEA